MQYYQSAHSTNIVVGNVQLQECCVGGEKSGNVPHALDRGTLRQTMVDSLYCLHPVVPERMCRVSKRSEFLYINSAPLTPIYLLALLPVRELSHVPRGLTDIAEAKQIREKKILI